MDVHVSLSGDDSNPGDENQPFRSVNRAVQRIAEPGLETGETLAILIQDGTYYLEKPVTITDSFGHPVEIKSTHPGKVTLSAGMQLQCHWEEHGNGVYKSRLPDDAPADFTQLFVDGKRMHRARYPSFCPDDHLVHGPGYIDTVESVEETGRVGLVYDPGTFTDKVWEHPEKAILHISHNWGFLQYRVQEVDRKNHRVYLGEGGWQINFVGPSGEVGMPDQSSLSPWIFGRRRFFIENVFEELDTPGEWYVEDEERILYYYPVDQDGLSDATVEIPVHEQAIIIQGERRNPVRNVTIEGLRFTHTTSTFLDEYEAPSLGDWTIHRSGAVHIENAEDCSVEECFFDSVGGTAVFINEHGSRVRIAHSIVSDAGESAFCVVGTRHKVYGSNRAYPEDVTIHDNYIHDIGAFGKQVAGVFISTARRVTVSHNVMHSLPRAGICLNDCWGGGHVIEHNEIYDTVRETRDHGPFNSWGREGYWCENQSHRFGSEPHPHPVYIRNMPEKTLVRNNYFHGIEGYVMGDYRQAIDMDDGTLNFHVYNNLCRDIAISIREGESRTVENNIIINPIVPMGMHVLFDGNHDVVRKNIIVTRSDIYHLNDAPPTQPWLSVDYNLFFNADAPWGYKPQVTVRQRGERLTKYTLDEWQDMGYDTHSVYADPQFINPEAGDYRVSETSPALELGFENFEMDFGLTDAFTDYWSNPR